jgi:ankyrin repeat protein
MSLFRVLSLNYKCFGCQGCQDKVITDALPSLVGKAAALSNYEASTRLQYAISSRASSSTSDAAIKSYYDTVYDLFTELPKMKAKNTLPSISPGHMVLNMFRQRDLSNKLLMRTVGGEFDSYGRTILHIGLEKNWTDQNFTPLISLVNVNHRDSLGRTPLGLACSKSNISIARSLIQHGAELDVPDKCGRSPLSWVAQTGLTSIAVLLLRNEIQEEPTSSEYQIRVDRKDNAGKTPLFYAIDAGHLDNIRLLLATGKVDPWPRSTNGQLPSRLSSALTRDCGIIEILRCAKATHHNIFPLYASANNEINLLRISPAVEVSYGKAEDEFTMSDGLDDEPPSHQTNQHTSPDLSPPLPGSTDNSMPKVDRIFIPQECNRKREWAEIKSSSGPGSGEFLRMLNAAKPWRGSISSSKASSSIHSSLSIRTKGVEYLKGFRCCGRNWSDFHQLLEHQETAHPESNPSPLSRIVLEE